MKKYILTIVPVIIIGASIVFASCEKEKASSFSMTNKSMKSEPKDTVIVGYSTSVDGEITLLIDKDNFLKAVEDSLNNSGGEYIVEELNLWNEEYKKGQFAPLMSISFYDLKEECGNVLFIQPTIINENGTLCYAVNGDSPHNRCFGGCTNPCKAILDNHGNFLMCQPCTDPMPNFSFSEWQERNAWLAIHRCSSIGGGGSSTEPSFRIVIGIIPFYGVGIK